MSNKLINLKPERVFYYFEGPGTPWECAARQWPR